MPESFFVDARDSSPAAAVAAAPALGHVRHKCNECGAPWRLGQSNCSRCGSIVFDEEYIEGTLLERIGDRIAAVVTPEKPESPRPPVALVNAVRDFQVATERYHAELLRIDEMVAAAVRDDGIEELQAVHGILHQATFTTGDASIQNVRHLSLGLRSLSGALPGAIDNLEVNP